MPQFQYQGVDRAGKKISGALDVPSEGELRMVLRSQGVRPTRIAKANALNTDLGALMGGRSTGKFNLITLLTFTRQLQVLISSGIPIVQGLELLEDQANDKSAKEVILGLRAKVSAGSYFWEALSAYPKAFPKIYVALIRAGESSGSIDQMLKRLSRYLEDSDRLRRMIKSAMMYPAIVITIGVGVVMLMMVMVIPKFEAMFKGAKKALPAPTQFVIDLSHFIVNHLFAIFAIAGTAGYVLFRFAKSEEGRVYFDHLMFRVPLFGPLMQKAGTARFSRTMQTLLASGVNLIDAIDICKATIGNAVLEDASSRIRSEIEAGKTLGQVIAKLKVFPRMAVQMIGVGESTGSLDKMLEKVADFYEEEVETMVNGLTKLIEPIVLVFLGGAVGGLLIALYLPIFSMAGGE